MAEYRRFVAYVYEYHKGKKGGNCGFIRVEARERLLRTEVHLKCPGLIPNVNCGVYGFTRGRGTLEGHLMGKCRTADGRADCVLETERNRIGGQDVALEQLGGMVLLMENGGFFGTEWDDQPIRPENFRENRQTGKKPAEKIPQNPVTEPVKEPDKETQAQTEKTAEQVINRNSVENPEKEPDIENAKKTPEGSDLKTQTVDDIHGELSEQQDDSEDTDTEAAQDQKEQTPADAAEKASEPESESGSGESVKENSEEKSSAWEPFPDGELTECEKIGVQDLGKLGRRSCCLRNNRFLQHGFYQFGHLLLCKNQRGQYMLGVPGGYSGQERYMANMFGFPWFKESGEIQVPGCRGGYWYRYMETDERRR